MVAKKDVVSIQLDQPTKEKIDAYVLKYSITRSAFIRWLANKFFLDKEDL